MLNIQIISVRKPPNFGNFSDNPASSPCILEQSTSFVPIISSFRCPLSRDAIEQEIVYRPSVWVGTKSGPSTEQDRMAQNCRYQRIRVGCGRKETDQHRW